MSASFLETMSKHLNVFQVYIRGTGYIAAFTDQNAFTFLQTIEELFNSGKIKIINDHIEEQIGAQFNSVLQLLTAKSDRDLLNAIMEKVTSVSFLKKLKRTSDSRSIRNSRDEIWRWSTNTSKTNRNNIV